MKIFKHVDTKVVNDDKGVEHLVDIYARKSSNSGNYRLYYREDGSNKMVKFADLKNHENKNGLEQIDSVIEKITEFVLKCFK